MTREPGQPARRPETDAKPAAPEDSSLEEPEGVEKAPGKKQARSRKAGRAVRAEAEGPAAGSAPVAALQERQPTAAASARETAPEKYQLPGSLRVELIDFKGTTVKWALMAILDDSAIMAKDLKPWQPSRLAAATAFLEKITGSLTPGSRLAVRDFYCSASERDKRGEGLPTCLSHMLYSWADLPLNGLKAKLEKLSPVGKTDPCAAAVHALQTDFHSSDGRTPRVLLLTSGSAKCALKKTLKAIDAKSGKDRARVDVLAVGMPAKKQPEYLALCLKSGGQFLKLENPSDVDPALARYGKVLKTPIINRITVKGGKSELSMDSGEEITLAPGEYTIVLPDLPGLASTDRTIKHVSIGSGENRSYKVRMKKGRPSVQVEKKESLPQQTKE
jgi:hypothetical protein